MRSLLIFVTTLSLTLLPLGSLAETTPSGVAPADEYFGHTSQSILEIRNRIARIDGKSDVEIRTPEMLGSIDYVEDAVLDWQHKYPGDPWVVDAMARLLECYARADAAADPHATAIITALANTYPNTPQTGEALLALDESITPDEAASPAQTSDDGAVISGEVVDASTGSPIPGAVVIVAPNHESSDVNATPFATTGSDGSFLIKGVPLGSAYTAGAYSLVHAEYIVVEPPRGSSYVAYHGVVDATDGKAQAGIIRLAAR